MCVASKRIDSRLLVFVAVLCLLGSDHQSAMAQTEHVLHSFTGGADGLLPVGGLVEDAKGNLYGTTENGGTSDYGVVFELTSTGVEKILYTFGWTNGALPEASLVRDSKGNLYGTTFSGGTKGWGTVFELSPSGSYTVQYKFTGGADGGSPHAALVRDSKGNLYGTTFYGGTKPGTKGFGTVFEVAPDGTEKTLYAFKSGGDGAYPDAGLVRDAKGNLYGTTQTGGTFGRGTVFEVSAAGVEKVLYSFTGGTDGWGSVAGLVRDTLGDLYGTTLYGGGSGCRPLGYGCGAVFEIPTTGQETTLYTFSGGVDGGNPSASLVRDKKGNLYGTTSVGGTNELGTVFEVIP